MISVGKPPTLPYISTADNPQMGPRMRITRRTGRRGLRPGIGSGLSALKKSASLDGNPWISFIRVVWRQGGHQAEMTMDELQRAMQQSKASVRFWVLLLLHCSAASRKSKTDWNCLS